MHAEPIETPHYRTIKSCLDTAIEQLIPATATPKLDAETLLTNIIGKSFSYLIAWPDKALDAVTSQRFNAFILRRINGEPVSYIVESKEFWSLPLTVTPDTLIPRPETELLVERALELIPPDQNRRIADLGTGSGAIALAIAKERPNAQIIATDLSTAALDVARYNAKQLRLTNVDFRHGFWFDALSETHFDLIVSNPPYIKKDDPHMQALRFEPHAALCPATGNDGLNDLHLLIREGSAYLKKGGFLLLEHGHDQQKTLSDFLFQNGYQGIQTLNDLAGINRAVMAHT